MNKKKRVKYANLKWILKIFLLAFLSKNKRHNFSLYKHVCHVCDPACLVCKQEWILKARSDNGCEK